MLVTITGPGKQVRSGLYGVIKSLDLSPFWSMFRVKNLNKDKSKDFVKDSGKLTFLQNSENYEQMILSERKWTYRIASNDIPPQFSIS